MVEYLHEQSQSMLEAFVRSWYVQYGTLGAVSYSDEAKLAQKF